MNSNIKKISPLKAIWVFNIFLALFYFSTFYGVKYFKSSVLEYSNITSDPFDGTVYPISFVPNWLKSKNTNKSYNFQDNNFSLDDFIEIPKYDVNLMQDSSGKDLNAILVRYTYPVVYIGSYRLNYQEYDGSHPAVDIRAPIGTPVLSVANGVIIKIKNTETGDGKYVIIRHDNISINGINQSLYSSYLHLSEIDAIEGTKVRKGDVIGKVGMTGITTTPHLHFQIDKKVAPFHAYWPFTFKDANTLGLDFFGAINVGLGKENAIEYTVHPLEFVQNNLSKISLNSAGDIDISNQIKESKQEVKTNLSADISNNIEDSSLDIDTGIQETLTGQESQETKVEVIDKKIEDQNNQKTTENTSISKTQEIVKVETRKKATGQIFYDIPLNSKYFNATKTLFDLGITKGYETGDFGVNNSLSRQEALIFILKYFKVNLDSARNISFKDIDKNSFIVPYIKKAIDLGLTEGKNKYFRPNDYVTRAEFITMFIKASGLAIINEKVGQFNNVKDSDWFAPYLYTFLKYLSLPSQEMDFKPNSLFSRGQIALILNSFKR